MKVCNARNGRELSSNVRLAESLFARMKGLLGKDRLEEGESLLIRPCNSVHTIGMRFPIDVIFLDRKNVAVGLRRDLRPNNISRLYVKAASVLELPSGTLADTDTEVGDKLEIV